MSDWLDNVRSFIQTPEVAATGGGLLSLRWLPVGSSWWNKFTSLSAGLAVAFWLIPFLIEASSIQSKNAVGAFSFIGGLLGLLLLSRLWDYVANTPFGEMLTSLFTRKPQP